MGPDVLASIRDAVWLYAAAPILLLVALLFTVRLRFPQITRFGAALRGVRESDPAADGEASPGLATVLATVGSFGAAAAIGTATAVALGGAGAIAWIWLFTFLIAPLRMAEALLARTDAPGKTERAATGSLALRLARDGSGAMRALGLVLAALVALAALGMGGAVHGAAVGDAAARLLPGSETWLVLGVAAVAAIFAIGGGARAGAIAGWIGLAALTVLFATAVWAALSEPSRALGAIARTVGEAIEGAPTATPFVGAFAGEVAFGAIVYALPPLASTTGVAGALHGLARARTTKAQAAAALLDPFAYAVVATLLGAAFVATGAFYTRVEIERPLDDLAIYAIPFETPSQRAEENRLHTGFMRVIDGQMRDLSLELGTERGMVESPRFEIDGRPANMALHVKDGKVFRFLLPGDQGALSEVPRTELARAVVIGRMLPQGGDLFGAALTRGTGDIGSRLALAALLALAAVAAAAWGYAAARSIPKASAKRGPRIAIALLPAAGIALAATPAIGWVAAGGLIAAGLLAIVASIALAARATEAAKLA